MTEYTDKMEDALFQLWGELDSSNSDYGDLLDYLNSGDFGRTFGDGLLTFLQRRKPDITAGNAVKYIESRCIVTGINKSDIASTNTLKNWFNGGLRPKKGEDSRNAIFALAFALQLSPYETAELFHKVYLDRAFDYRNSKEIVYYYCLQNNKTWAEAKRLIEITRELTVDSSDYTIYTEQIRIDIESIGDEMALIAYIGRHGHNMEKKNVAAKRTKLRLIQEAKKTAEEEKSLIKRRAQSKMSGTVYEDYQELEGYRNTSANSLNHLYEVITDQSVRGKTGTKTLFKNTRLPVEIKRRFPEAVTLSKKEPTYEELRKLIILLGSYTHWYNFQKEAKLGEIGNYIDDYIEDMNAYLDESGLPPMYYGNPYDWLFMYCSLFERPLDTFRGILAELFPDEEDSQ